MPNTPDPRRWSILRVTLLIGFMALLDVTIVNVALPSMRAGLDASPGTIQWVVSGYALTFGLTLVAGGRLGDAHGRRTLMLVGLGGFIASSAAVGLAPNVELVIAARLAQGVSAGLLTPQSSGLIQQLFRGAERGRAFGYFGLTVSIASATGPLLGGLVIGAAGTDLGWRLLFLVNVPIGLAAMVAVYRLVPRRIDAVAQREHLDIVGALLLGGAVVAVLYPTVAYEGGARWPLLLLAAAPVLAWGFARWERRVQEAGHTPLLDLRLLRSLPDYTGGLLIGALYFTGFTGVLLTTSLYLQDGRGLSALHAGLLLTPLAVGSAVTAPLAGRVVTRIGRPLTVGALLVIMAALGLAALIVPGSSNTELVWTLGPALALAGLGGGAVVGPNFTLTLADVPPRMGGAAGGAVQTGQRLGSALGAALLATVYQSVASRGSVDDGLRAAYLTALGLLVFALLAAVRALHPRERATENDAEAHAPAAALE